MDHASVARSARGVADALSEVNETFQHRSDSARSNEDWIAATGRLRTALFALYPPDLDMNLITAGDKSAIEAAIVFLEVDPWVFRSGYQKRRLLDRLARAKLAESDKQRLRTVVVRTTMIGARMEFHHTLRLAHHVRSDAFVEELERAVARAPPSRRDDFGLILGAVKGTRRTAQWNRNKRRS